MSNPVEATKPRYDASEDVFTGDMIAVLKLALRAIQSRGYKIDDANETLGFRHIQHRHDMELMVGGIVHNLGLRSWRKEVQGHRNGKTEAFRSISRLDGSHG